MTKGWELDSPTFVNEFATLALGFALLGSRALRPLTVLLWFCVSGLSRCVSRQNPMCDLRFHARSPKA
jgi:hypothetical protein